MNRTIVVTGMAFLMALAIAGSVEAGRRAGGAGPMASTKGAARAPASIPPPSSDEEARRRVIAKQSSREAQVAAETDDPEWSRPASESFRKELEAVGAQGRFTVQAIECKTSSCLAKLSWGSYSDASKGWRSVLHAASAKKCEREVFVPPPEKEQLGAPYEGEVFVDCAKDRKP